MKKILLLLLLSLSLFGADIHYIYSYDEAIKLAKKEQKPLLLFMTQKNGRAFKYMNENVFNDTRMNAYISKNYLVAKIDVHDKSVPVHLQVKMTPTFHFILADATKFRPSIVGAKKAQEFYKTLTQAKNIKYFYEAHVHHAPNNKTLLVKDTDTALGRYNLLPKELKLRTLIDAHGHLCDDLIITFIAMSQGLNFLFDGGTIDRTDLRASVRNNPAIVDTVSIMSGARINFRTLSLDNSLGHDIILERVSTNEILKITLKDPSFLKDLDTQKRFIKKTRYSGKNVSAQDINTLEKLSKEAIITALNMKIDALIEIEKLNNYTFEFHIQDLGKRNDTINKSMPR